MTALTWDEGYETRASQDPSVEDATDRILALNGRDRTLVTLYRDEAHLAVGGSAATGLIVYCTFDNEVFWQVVVDGDPTDVQDVVAGGQAGAYPASHVASASEATRAAAEFLLNARRSGELRWETQ